MLVITEVVGNGYLIISAVSFNNQVVAGTGEYHIGRRGTLKTQSVCPIGRVGILGHNVLPMAFGKDIGVGFVRTAEEPVVAGTSDQGIVAGTAAEGIITFTAFQPVVTLITAERIVAGTAQQDVVAVAAKQSVVTGTAVQMVVAVVAM